jgi:hypothetical protein
MTIKKAAKLTYDCAAFSDIHFAIVEKYSIVNTRYCSLTMHTHIYA